MKMENRREGNRKLNIDRVLAFRTRRGKSGDPRDNDTESGHKPGQRTAYQTPNTNEGQVPQWGPSIGLPGGAIPGTSASAVDALVEASAVYVRAGAGSVARGMTEWGCRLRPGLQPPHDVLAADGGPEKRMGGGDQEGLFPEQLWCCPRKTKIKLKLHRAGIHAVTMCANMQT